MNRPVILPAIDEAEADYRATRAILDAEDESSGAIGWIVATLSVFVMGFAIGWSWLAEAGL